MDELEETVRALAPRLARYCSALSGDSEIGADAAQIALTALVRRWRSGRKPNSPEAYGFAIGRRTCYRLLLRRRLWLPLATLMDHRSRDINPEQQAVDRQAVKSLLRVLSGLPRADREVLALVAAGDVPVKRAAQLLGISESALKMRVHRARKKLRERLDYVDDRRTT